MALSPYSPGYSKSDIFLERLDKVRSRMQADGLCAMLITNPDNVKYLTAFRWGQHSLMLVDSDSAVIVARTTEHQQALEEAHGCKVLLADGVLSEKLLSDYVSSGGHRIRRIGIETGFLSVAVRDRLSAYLGDSVELVAAPDLVTEMRAIKEPWEIELIAKACSIYDDMMRSALPHLEVGMSENELAARLEFESRVAGGEGFWFPSIVVSGPRSALPHGFPAERRIESGEFLKIDMGPMFGGMASDATRTIAFGECTDKMKEVYYTVREAQLASLSECKAGVIASAVHTAAQRVIEKAGYGQYFNHGVGHGIWGPPQIAPNSERELLEGMVVTVEPGIYIPGWGGVRIEDTVVITGDGCRILHSFTKDLVVL